MKLEFPVYTSEGRRVAYLDVDKPVREAFYEMLEQIFQGNPAYEIRDPGFKLLICRFGYETTKDLCEDVGYPYKERNVRIIVADKENKNKNEEE